MQVKFSSEQTVVESKAGSKVGSKNKILVFFKNIFLLFSIRSFWKLEKYEIEKWKKKNENYEQTKTVK